MRTGARAAHGGSAAAPGAGRRGSAGAGLSPQAGRGGAGRRAGPGARRPARPGRRAGSRQRRRPGGQRPGPRVSPSRPSLPRDPGPRPRPRPRRANSHGGPAEPAGCARARGHEEEGRRRPGQSGLGAAPQPQPQSLGARGGRGRRQRRGARAGPRDAGAPRGGDPRGPGEWPRSGPFPPHPTRSRFPRDHRQPCGPAPARCRRRHPPVGTAWPSRGAQGGSAAKAGQLEPVAGKLSSPRRRGSPGRGEPPPSLFGVAAPGAARLRLGHIPARAGPERGPEHREGTAAFSVLRAWHPGLRPLLAGLGEKGVCASAP